MPFEQARQKDVIAAQQIRGYWQPTVSAIKLQYFSTVMFSAHAKH
jgi:hypothetical protein